MRRPNIYDFSSRERALLADLILEYTTPEIIDRHWNAVLSGAHDDPVGFLSFHRSYILGLEEFLIRRGYGQWAPLPAWNPAEPIPLEFNIPSTGPGRLLNLNPGVSFAEFFEPAYLLGFPTEAELGEALIPRHNLVHSRIGGIMNNLRLAPAAPIFWLFHSFIDDIWWEWQRLTIQGFF